MKDAAIYECNSCNNIFKGKNPDFCNKCNSEDIKIKSINIVNIPFLLNVSGYTNQEKLHIKTRGLLKNRFLKSFSQLYSYMDNQKPGHNGKKLVFSLYLPPLSSKPFKRVIKNHLLKGFFKVSGGPDAATIAITQNCQANCIHCSAHRRLVNKRDELTTNEWTKIIKNLVNSGCYNITFTGGEPLLHPDIFKLIRSVDKKKAIAQMFTNGYCLTKETALNLKKSGLDSIHISIDSTNPKIHDKQRRLNGLFKRATEGVKYCIEAGLLTGISVVTTPEILKNGELKKFLELGKKLNVHNITFADPVPTGKWLNKNTILTKSQHRYLEDFHLETNRRANYSRIETMSYVNGPRGAGCFGGINQIHMTSTGEVTPCDLTPLSFGNIKTETIKQIWKKMRKHPEYKLNRRSCRMQNPEFRKKYIKLIPKNAELPYPIQLIDKKIIKT